MKKYDEYEELVIQRRVHKCQKGLKKLIKEKMKSCINIGKKEAKTLLENNKIKNNKIVNNKEKENDDINNPELDGNISDFTNTFKIVSEYYY